MKKDIIKILSKRAEHFEKIHHSFEAREIKSAIDTIERLMPPELLVRKSFKQIINYKKKTR